MTAIAEAGIITTTTFEGHPNRTQTGRDCRCPDGQTGELRSTAGCTHQQSRASNDMNMQGWTPTTTNGNNGG
ncbi:hypothetical protein Tco_0791290 [Tanacetum coccineum]